MEMGRSPGTDGLPAEFYKVFWNDVATYLLASLNSSFSKGHLSISQRRGLITLIPKKNKPQQYLKNWMPISLLNCDYKIAAKAVATRKTLLFYNFGDSLITWIKLFYTDISSSVQNNGWSSEFFQLNRGVRQGCPLSTYVFILCVEILGNAIRNCDQIKGICVLD